MIRLVCIVFGNYPSTNVRGLGREKYLNNQHVDWVSINLNPRINIYEKKLIFRINRKLAALITPFGKIWENRRMIKNANCVYVIKYPTVLQIKILKLLNKNIFFDFDDPIWLPDFAGFRKFRKILELCRGFTCDNVLQLEVAKKFNNFGIAVPGIVPEIDTRVMHSKKRIIWVGSASTKQYIEMIKFELEKVLRNNQNLTLMVMGIADLNFSPDVDVKYIPEYSEKEMIANLKNSDIGIFPFCEDELGFARGIHKARIYATAGLPVVATNSILFQNSGINQEFLFLCNDGNDWFKHLTFLSLENPLKNHGYKYDASWNNISSTEKILELIKFKIVGA